MLEDDNMYKALLQTAKRHQRYKVFENQKDF